VGATKIFTDPLKLQGERLVLRDRTFSKGIRIEDSRVILERCIIEGGQFAAVDVTGAHAKVLLRGCRIQGSGTGVRINDRAMVRMIDCEVTNHPENGILVRGGSWLRVRKSRIHHNGLDGLCSVGANSVFVHRSEIMDNCRVAIHLDGGRSVMTHTRISGPHKIGLKLGDHGRFILRNVDIRECSQVGLEAEQSSKILAVDSSICQQGGVGLSVQSKSRVRLRKCRIRDNHIGIQLSDTATLALRACETQGNQDRDWQIEPGARIIQSTT
jgi:nitrous oxidase accessory protein NosD